MPDPRPTFDKIVWAQVEELKAIDPRAAAIACQILDYTRIRNKDIGKENFGYGLLTGLAVGVLLCWMWL